MTGETANTQSVTIQNRQRAELSGIREVESFDDSGVSLRSSAGDVSVEGEELKIDSFSMESGRVVITGKINGIYYTDAPRAGKSFFFSRRAQ